MMMMITLIARPMEEVIIPASAIPPCCFFLPIMPRIRPMMLQINARKGDQQKTSEQMPNTIEAMAKPLLCLGGGYAPGMGGCPGMGGGYAPGAGGGTGAPGC